MTIPTAQPVTAADVGAAVQAAALAAFCWTDGHGAQDYAEDHYMWAVDLFVHTRMDAPDRERLGGALSELAEALHLPPLHPDAWLAFIPCPVCGAEFGDHPRAEDGSRCPPRGVS